MKVRDAQPEDNEALVALAAQCPMVGDLSLCVDRRPEFFALSRLSGYPWRVGVIDGDTGPIGCVGVARRAVYLDGRATQLAYIGDLKVRPDHRGRGAGRALARWAMTAARDLVGDDGPLLATVLAGNTAVDTLRRDLAPTVRRWATVRSHSISLLWRRRRPRTGLAVRPAGPADGPAMVALWRRLSVARQFAPILESFPVSAPGPARAERAPWGSAPGPGPDYLLAHGPDGELVGFIGLWDQHGIKQMRVTGYSRRLAAARVGFNLAAPLFRAPRLPPPGGALRHRTVVNPCASDARTLRTLLVHAGNRLRGQCSFLTIGLDTRDPLSRALAGLFAQPTDVDLLVLGPTPRGTAPAHFEIATV
jgi:GNAT superfamily N-acetyltransferase